MKNIIVFGASGDTGHYFVNYFLEQLENHLFVDIKYSTNIIHFNHEIIKNYTALIIYKVE